MCSRPPDTPVDLLERERQMSSDTVRIMCPNLVCRKVLAVPKSARGKTVKCRNCGISIRIPAGGSAPAKPTDSAPPAADGTKQTA
jgi:ribosomal protein S27E